MQKNLQLFSQKITSTLSFVVLWDSDMQFGAIYMRLLKKKSYLCG